MPSLFFSYSHRDEELRNELEMHLSMLKREGIISAWHDRRIDAGENIHGEISARLEECEIVLLLVSASFLASDYCFDKEMLKALERSEQGLCTVIPVILRPCDWHTAPFGALRATPTDGKPVSMFGNQDEALTQVAMDVRQAAKKYANRVSAQTISRPTIDQLPISAPNPRSSNLRVPRVFSDRDRDDFEDSSFEYLARYFDGSLAELQRRNEQLQTKFQRLDKRTFTSSIYRNGEMIAHCCIWFGGSILGKGIFYSSNREMPGSSFNESLTVSNDGYSMHLRAMGIAMTGQKVDALSQEGAAEYLWSMLLAPLQGR